MTAGRIISQPISREDLARMAETQFGDLYLEEEGPDWIEFDSLINIRPGQGNRSRSVDDEHTRERIRALVSSLILAE